MFIPYLQRFYLFFFFSFCMSISYADVYKWVDENGETHYSQQAPVGQQADIIKAPPPPSIDPDRAQAQVDMLIHEQQQAKEARLEAQQQQYQQQQQREQQQQRCERSKYNLQQYQNNPGRRMIGSDGEATRQTEEERQQKIQQLTQEISANCN
jgi:hypothetical protein